ncbi:MAG: hypothetical protein U9R37_01735, partial [Campylobacterota bacterium]|nr:hypothetical protein [Campylobacterota bacterium]
PVSPNVTANKVAAVTVDNFIIFIFLFILIHRIILIIGYNLVTILSIMVTIWLQNFFRFIL